MAALTLLKNLRQQNDQSEEQARYERERFEQRQQQAASNAVSMVQSGVDKKKVLTVFGTDLSEQGRALVEINADFVKQKKSEQEAMPTLEAAANPLISQLARSGADPNTEQYAHSVSLLAQLGNQLGLSNEQISPMLERFAPSAAAQFLQNQESELSRRQALESSVEKETALGGVRQGFELQTDAVKRQRELKNFSAQQGILRNFGLLKQADEARYAGEAESLAATIRESPQAVSGKVLSIQENLENPALEMPIIWGQANKLYAAASDFSGIQEDFRARGYAVPTSLARDVVSGKAAIDEFTGLISRDFGERADDMRQGRATSMYELIEMREVARRVATGPLSGKNVPERWAWIAEQTAAYQAGEADPLYTEFRNRRDRLVAALARASFTGTLSDQERRFTDALVSQPRMLSGNQSGTGLAQQMEANFNALEAGITTKYRSAVPRSVFSDDVLRREIEQRKKEHADQFRASYLEVQYPSKALPGGWERVQ